MAQRVVACTVCHGAQGRAGPDGYYPRLAGKPAGYLYHQLLNFRDGRRHYGLMTDLVDPLSDAYLREIAEYFAALDVPYAEHQATAPATPLSPSQQARGEQLAKVGDPRLGVPACAQCHGQALTGTLPNTPGLIGLPRAYLSAQLGAWRTGQRRAVAPDCMAAVARKLSPDDVVAVTSWLAAQPVPAHHQPAPAPTLRTPAPPASVWRCGSAPELDHLP